MGQQAELEVAGVAPGSIEIAIYDLLGRKVVSRFVEGARDGQLRFSLTEDSPALSSGVYFARVRDSAGIESNTVRLVVFR